MVRSLNLSDDIKTAYDRDGVIIIKNLFSKDLIADALKEIEEFFRVQAKINSIDLLDDSLEGVIRSMMQFDPILRKNMYQFVQNMFFLRKMSCTDNVFTTLEKLKLNNPVFRNMGLRVDLPEEVQFLQPLHQDIRGILADYNINFWCPLQTVNAECGTLVAYPKSHLKGPLNQELSTVGNNYQTIPDDQVKEFERVEVEAEAGDAVLFNSYIVHGSVVSKNKRLRLTNVIRYDSGAEMEWLLTNNNPLAKFNIQEAK